MVDVLIYQKALEDCPFRKLLFSLQFLYVATGMLDLVFVRRWNLALGVPDSFFMIAEECVSRVVSRIRWMPMIVLSTKLCPLGIEGMFFALLMCIDGRALLRFLASMVGVLIYQKALEDCPFRKLLFSLQFLYVATGMLDLVFVRRWNLALGVPDSFFMIAEECVSRVVSRIRWMPMIVLSTKLCPLGIEGMFFALLMCIDGLGFLSSKMGEGLVLRLMHVTRTDFRNLWLALLIRNVLQLATLGLIFLVPKAEQSDVIVASSTLSNKNESADGDYDYDYDGHGHEHEGLQLVPTTEKSEV